MKRNKRNTFLIIFIILIGISLGYAYLNTNLNINGTSLINSPTWNVHWDNVEVKSGSVTTVNTPATIQTGLTEVVFNVDLNKPGDYYEFTVDAVNSGSIDAMVDVVNTGVYAVNGVTPKQLPDYLEYTITYSDGVAIEQNHLLAHNSTEKYKVRVHYKEDINANQLPSTNDNYMFKIGVNYKQSNSSAIPKPEPSFSNSSWAMIVSKVQSGNIPSSWTVGSTKEVDMGEFGTHTIRIANISTPSECNTVGFSQTACGFVFEFTKVIDMHVINSINNNAGGWRDSEMRAYINDEIYNALPAELKSEIIDTTVVSGHGASDSNNLITTDKLYLLSMHELWEDVDGNPNDGPDYYDSSYNNTRQLDYYLAQGVTTDNYIGAIKQTEYESDTYWWLRSASYHNSNTFCGVYYDGGRLISFLNNSRGVSPAFRIG